MAEECLASANNSADKSVAERWRKRAQEYQTLSEAMDISEQSDASNFKNNEPDTK